MLRGGHGFPISHLRSRDRKAWESLPEDTHFLRTIESLNSHDSCCLVKCPPPFTFRIMIQKTLFPGLTMNDCQGQRVTSTWPLHGCLGKAVGVWERENWTLCQMDLGLSSPTLSSSVIQANSLTPLCLSFLFCTKGEIMPGSGGLLLAQVVRHAQVSWFLSWVPALPPASEPLQQSLPLVTCSTGRISTSGVW